MGLYTLYAPAVSTGPVHAALSRAAAALERGQSAEALQALTALQRTTSLSRDDELSLRTGLAEAWLLQDNLAQAVTALGRTPDTLRDPLPPSRLSTLWRLHGRVAFARGDQSRAIALHTRALKQAEAAHDSRAIGLAHYELSLCYEQVGDSSIVRDHLTEAASALHAAGDRRHLAQVHSLSAVLLAQSGRYEEAITALRHAERLALAIDAADVLAGIVHNQANVAMMRHRHDQALALAERSLALHERTRSSHGLAIALATLGQICVQVGDLDRAEQVLNRTLEVRTPVQFHETTGAVFDTLAQIHLMRGSYERADEYLRQAAEGYGSDTGQTSRWYEWSLKVLAIRLAIRRHAYTEALSLADELVGTPGAPPGDTLAADLAAAEALLLAGRVPEAERRLIGCESRLDPRTTPGKWGEYLRLRGSLQEATGHQTEAYHDYGQSVNVFDLLGERYQGGLSELALGRLAARAGARSSAERSLAKATQVFRSLGAQRDLAEALAATALLATPVNGPYLGSPVDADDVLVRRLVDAAIMPELLAREVAAALLEITHADAAVVFVSTTGGDLQVLAAAGCDTEVGRALGRAAAQGSPAYGPGLLLRTPLGRHPDGDCACVVASQQALGAAVIRRVRMIAAIARQGFELCGARERTLQPLELPTERSLEPLLPGFVCASAAMARVTEQIQRLQGHDLTVLITGESGTGKDLVARAIHVGSPRKAAMFLPYNCTTTSRDMADSQLFGHRRGSFTGAVSDQPGLIRTAAGGTLLLDEIGDLPLDIQPKLLRFLEQGEIMPVGDSRPQRVDVRVLAATNADLEQRVVEGRFREDLYYRLSVIRIHVPPLRERREEIPHLSTLFLREATERFARPDVQLSSRTLDLFADYWWPGNVRQLRNEIQRAVAMSPPSGIIDPQHLSPDLTAPAAAAGSAVAPAFSAGALPSGKLAPAVEHIEREMIRATLGHTSGNISEAARTLGLTRRGLYLKIRRLGVEGGQLDT